jgi:DNA-binding response OmpR family regulator
MSSKELVMSRDSSEDPAYVSRLDIVFEEREQIRRRESINDEQVTPRAGYLVELSGQPINLEFLEFRILRFLAAKPYHAFTPRQIVQAVATEEHPVTEAELSGHIASLRAKLGLFSDYVQSVPYVGYRFKA